MKPDRHAWLDVLLEAESTPPAGYERRYLMPPPLPDEPSRIDALALDISGRCNLSCRYCAEASTQPGGRPAMPPGMLDEIFRFIGALGPGRRSLRFGSGEPMLNREFLRELQRRIDEAFPADAADRPGVFITTNGTLIDDDDIEWLAGTGWQVKVSIDGPEEVHDRWRVYPGGQGTYAKVAATVREFARRMPDRFSVTAVLAAGNDPATVFRGLEELGVRRIELVPAAHEDPDIRPGLEDVRRFRTFVESHVDRLIAGEPGTPDLVRLANRVTRVMGYDNSFIHCGAGRNFVGLDSSGQLYPCFRFIGVDGYRLGTVTTGIDPDAGKMFRHRTGRPWDRRESCRDCWAAPLCGGPCFAVSELFGSGDGEPLRIHCAYTLIESRGAWRLVETLRKQNPARLLEYLPPDFLTYAQETPSGQTA